MKTFKQHVLILGGFYFIISSILDLWENQFFIILNFLAFGVFAVMFLYLCFKRSLGFINHFQNRFFKLTNYLLAFGVLEYISLIFGMIPGAIYGYNAARAEYNKTEYHSLFSQYFEYFSYIYIAILILALAWATYKSFFANRNKTS